MKENFQFVIFKFVLLPVKLLQSPVDDEPKLELNVTK